MSTAQPVSRPIEFRNAADGTTVAVMRETRPHLLADELHKMLGGMPDFFSGEATILDFSELGDVPAQIDWSGLVTMFRRFQLSPVGVRNLRPDLAPGARAAGLEVVAESGADAPAPPLRRARTPTPRQASAPPAAAPPPPVAARVATMFIDRPLRSGQQVYARGGDLVLLAGMSNGAEVIADGSIHCYGPLRGRALAGAQGDTSARIIATNFGPEIVSIAGVYRTFEQGVAPEIAGKPAHVWLIGTENQQKLGIEPLQLD